MFSLSKDERKILINTTRNPFNYNEQYFEIYEKEKTYKNLRNFDHLNDITNYNLEYRTSSINNNIIYAPKIQVPYEFNFNILFTILAEIFDEYIDKIFICGGAALSYYFLNNCEISLECNDIDLFISDTETPNDIVYKLFNNSKKFGIESIKNSENTISFNLDIESRTIKFQIIKRVYTSPSEIIHGFDIDCSCILINLVDKKIYITDRGLFSLINQYNTINFERLSPSYPYRLFKYYCRGFSIFDPFLDYFKENFITDFRPYYLLEGSLVLYYKLLKFSVNYTENNYLSDYDTNNDISLNFTDIDKINFKRTNPSEQSNNTFNRLILEDPKSWYIIKNLKEYERPKYLGSDLVREIYQNNGTIFKESYYPYRLKIKHNERLDNLKYFLEKFKGNLVVIGDVPFQLFTNIYFKNPLIEFCFINSLNLNDDVKKLIESFGDFYCDVINKNKDENYELLEIPKIKNLEYNSNLAKFKNKHSLYEYKYKSGFKEEIVTIKINFSNFDSMQSVLANEKMNFLKVLLTYDGKFYSNELGYYSILNRYKFGDISNIYKKYGVSLINPHINEKITNIFTSYTNDSYKIYGNPREVKILYGPTNLTFFKINNRRLLILGETHSNKLLKYEDNNSSTFDLHMWLYKLSKFAPECLDIYLETNKTRLHKSNRRKGKISDFNNPISSIESIFSNCNINNCFTDKVRYHMIDIRQISENLFGPFYELNQKISYSSDLISIKLRENKEKFLSYCNQNKKGYIWNDNLKNIYKILYYISGFNMSNENKISFIESYKILTFGTEFSLESTKFDEYINLYIAKIKKSIKKIENFNVNKFFETLISCYLESNDFYAALICINMDVYFLLRYLQTFKKLELGPKDCRNNEFKISKNSIIHAGGYHSNIYINFIKKWFNTEPVLSIEQDYQKSQKIIFDTPFDFFG